MADRRVSPGNRGRNHQDTVRFRTRSRRRPAGFSRSTGTPSRLTSSECHGKKKKIFGKRLRYSADLKPKSADERSQTCLRFTNA